MYAKVPTIMPADEARLVDGHRQAEVPELRRPVLGQPHIAGLEVAMDDAIGMGVVQRRQTWSAMRRVSSR